MNTATMAGAALVGLFGLALTPAAEAQTAPPPRPPASAAPAQPSPAPPSVPQAGAPQAQRSPTGRLERRRRPSYASCNRMSHARGLTGGARRRFLIRCKLGYVRPRAGQPPQGQTAPARQP